MSTPGTVHAVTAATLVLYVLVAAAAVAAVWSRRRRRKAAAAGAVPHTAPAAVLFAMPAGHPERPGPPLEYELVWNGDFYEFVAAQLADITVSDS